MRKSPFVLALFAIMFLASLTPAQAQCLKCEAGQAIGSIPWVLGDVYRTKTAKDIELDSHRTAERINDRQMNSADRQTDAYEKVAMAQIVAQMAANQAALEAEELSAALGAQQASAETGRSSCGSAGTARVCGRLIVDDAGPASHAGPIVR